MRFDSLSPVAVTNTTVHGRSGRSRRSSLSRGRTSTRGRTRSRTRGRTGGCGIHRGTSRRGAVAHVGRDVGATAAGALRLAIGSEAKAIHVKLVGHVGWFGARGRKKRRSRFVRVRFARSDDQTRITLAENESGESSLVGTRVARVERKKERRNSFSFPSELSCVFVVRLKNRNLNACKIPSKNRQTLQRKETNKERRKMPDDGTGERRVGVLGG